MPNIRVALRVRPISQREIEGNYPVAVAVENNSAFITDIRVPERPSADSRQRFRQFDFDHIFWFSNNKVTRCSASQQEVYREMGPHLEKAILAGYNACLLAYGQSGSGKTHTMIGSRDDPGIIPRLCQSLWDKLKATYPPQPPLGKATFRMEVSFLEIYREKVRDLLNPDSSLKLREHPQLGPHVQGLTRLEVTGEISLLDLLWEGERRRASGNTTSNRRSSRSHAIWTLYLTVYTTSTNSTNNENNTDDNGANNNNNDNSHSSTRRTSQDRRNYSPGVSTPSCSNSKPGANSKNNSSQSVITNQVHLVDLAGSEKADCTTAKSLLAEGADINRSLVALGNVISALSEKAQYIPYRDSALTWLLRDSIGGNASTSIIITASPSSDCHTQTLNSLRFAQRARLVENTPKINLAPASSSHYGPYGFLSVMSAMELKKDISRLAKIIKTAQSNGGILRGLAPRSGWTRLISAIEGIGQAEKEQVKLQRQRANSEDTTASSSFSHRGVGGGSSSSPSTPGASSSSATITTAKSLNDVMVQANMEKRHPLLSLQRQMSRKSESALISASSSSQSSPTKVVGTEVFIPTSSSFKCLTWQQEEAQPVPKPISSSNASSLLSIDEPDEDGSSTLQSASSNTQIHHMKYMLEVQYPITHNLDHASRISERIHGNITDENYQQKTSLDPVDVQSEMPSEEHEVQGVIPTLVQPRDFSEILNEQVEVEPTDILNKKLLHHKSVLVCNTGKQDKDYLFPTKCKHFATHAPYSAISISPFESSDEQEFHEPEEIDTTGNHNFMRAVYSEFSKEKTLEDENRNCTFEDTCYFTGGESILSQKPHMIISSSSSYESINFPDPVHPVNLIREFSRASDDFEEGYLEDLTIDEGDVFHENFVPPIANVCMVAGQPMDIAVPIEILVEEPNCLDNTPRFNPINGVSDSKFRNYFAKELHQMEKMGKQIKGLLQMTQRYNVVKPFLDEISNLQNSDHSKPDPHVDAHIDSCSGWNVEVELAKVHQEIHQLNKVLKTGIGQDGMTTSGNAHNGTTSSKVTKSANGHSSTSNGNKNFNNNNYLPAKYASSSTSTVNNDVGVTSDSSIDVDGFYPSFAHTRQIPLLSGGGGAKTSKSAVTVNHNNVASNPSSNNHFQRSLPSARGSVSQPILFSNSRSSNIVNGNVSNAPTTSTHFTPNAYSTPQKPSQQYRKNKSSLWTKSSGTGFSDLDEEVLISSSHQQPPLVTPFLPHPAPPSVNSFHTFFKNSKHGGHPQGRPRLQYFPSNSNTSSVSSNTSLGMLNYDAPTNHEFSSGSGFPLNISSSEPRKFSELLKDKYRKGSESSSSFQSSYQHQPSSEFQNSFHVGEIRNHKHLTENGAAGRGDASGLSSRFSSVTKDADDWLPNGVSSRTFGKMKNLGSDDMNMTSGFKPYQHIRSHSDSLDLCSCEDTNSKYSSSVAAPLSSLDKASVRSRLSSCAGSTATDASDQLRVGSINAYFPSAPFRSQYQYQHQHQHQHQPQHLKSLRCRHP